MSTAPRRRQSAAVYRRRRLVVLLALAAVVAAVVLAIWQPWRSSAAPLAGPSPSGSSSAAAESPAESPDATPVATSLAEESPSAAASETAPAPQPAPSASASPGILACTTADLTVLAVTDKESYGAGELPQLSITLSNTSAVPCLINVGTATQSFVVTSGSDTWWRSTDCQSESSDQVVQLAAGQTVSSVTPLVWDRTRSAVDTCGSSSRPAAPAGYFHLQVSIGGIQGADTAMFRLR